MCAAPKVLCRDHIAGSCAPPLPDMRAECQVVPSTVRSPFSEAPNIQSMTAPAAIRAKAACPTAWCLLPASLGRSPVQTGRRLQMQFLHYPRISSAFSQGAMRDLRRVRVRCARHVNPCAVEHFMALCAPPPPDMRAERRRWMSAPATVRSPFGEALTYRP